MKKRMYYYTIFGKARHTPISYKCQAENKASAVISFYVDTEGTDIVTIYRTNKPQDNETN